MAVKYRTGGVEMPVGIEVQLPAEVYGNITPEDADGILPELAGDILKSPFVRKLLEEGIHAYIAENYDQIIEDLTDPDVRTNPNHTARIILRLYLQKRGLDPMDVNYADLVRDQDFREDMFVDTEITGFTASAALEAEKEDYAANEL